MVDDKTKVQKGKEGIMSLYDKLLAVQQEKEQKERASVEDEITKKQSSRISNDDIKKAIRTITEDLMKSTSATTCINYECYLKVWLYSEEQVKRIVDYFRKEGLEAQVTLVEMSIKSKGGDRIEERWRININLPELSLMK